MTRTRFGLGIPRDAQVVRDAGQVTLSEERFRWAVRSRARGFCEAIVPGVCAGRYEHAHHVVPKGRGVGLAWLHDAEANGLGVCAACHDWIHANPASATALGLLASRPVDGVEPAPVLVRIDQARQLQPKGVPSG